MKTNHLHSDPCLWRLTIYTVIPAYKERLTIYTVIPAYKD